MENRGVCVRVGAAGRGVSLCRGAAVPGASGDPCRPPDSRQSQHGSTSLFGSLESHAGFIGLRPACVGGLRDPTLPEPRGKKEGTGHPASCTVPWVESRNACAHDGPCSPSSQGEWLSEPPWA
jgi:hypothetical protein